MSSLLWRERLFTFTGTSPTLTLGASSGPSEGSFLSVVISLAVSALEPEFLECSVTVETLLSSTFNKDVLPPIEAWREWAIYPADYEAI